MVTYSVKILPLLAMSILLILPYNISLFQKNEMSCCIEKDYDKSACHDKPTSHNKNSTNTKGGDYCCLSYCCVSIPAYLSTGETRLKNTPEKLLDKPFYPVYETKNYTVYLFIQDKPPAGTFS